MFCIELKCIKINVIICVTGLLHLGILTDDGSLDSVKSNQRLAEISVEYAKAGKIIKLVSCEPPFSL